MKKFFALLIVAMGIMNATLAHAKTCVETNTHEISLKVNPNQTVSNRPKTPQPVVKAFLEDEQVSITASHYIGTVRVCILNAERSPLLTHQADMTESGVVTVSCHLLDEGHYILAVFIGNTEYEGEFDLEVG